MRQVTWYSISEEVVKRIKANFTKPMQIEDLAGQANMSSSSFHHHFKAVTSMSPLQYQKQLRLLEARRLMLAESSEKPSAKCRCVVAGEVLKTARCFAARVLHPQRDHCRLVAPIMRVILQ